MPSRPGERVQCPHCGRENPAVEDRCVACSKSLVVYIGPAAVLPRRVGLGSLMLLVATVAPGLALLRTSPPVGVVVLALLVPAAVRTIAVIAQHLIDERPISTAEKVEAFLGSIGLMVATLGVGGLAFASSLFLIGSMTFQARGFGLPFAFAVSGGVGIFGLALVLRAYWTYRG